MQGRMFSLNAGKHLFLSELGIAGYWLLSFISGQGCLLQLFTGMGKLSMLALKLLTVL